MLERYSSENSLATHESNRLKHSCQSGFIFDTINKIKRNLEKDVWRLSAFRWGCSTCLKASTFYAATILDWQRDTIGSRKPILSMDAAAKGGIGNAMTKVDCVLQDSETRRRYLIFFMGQVAIAGEKIVRNRDGGREGRRSSKMKPNGIWRSSNSAGSPM